MSVEPYWCQDCNSFGSKCRNLNPDCGDRTVSLTLFMQERKHPLEKVDLSAEMGQ